MVKRKIIWTQRTKIDILEILDFYFKRNASKSYSKKLKTQILKSIKLLENHSDIGVHTDIQNVRNLIAGDYCIFYEIKVTTIEILTIWDNRQNPGKLEIIE